MYRMRQKYIPLPSDVKCVPLETILLNAVHMASGYLATMLLRSSQPQSNGVRCQPMYIVIKPIHDDLNLHKINAMPDV